MSNVCSEAYVELLLGQAGQQHCASAQLSHKLAVAIGTIAEGTPRDHGSVYAASTRCHHANQGYTAPLTRFTPPFTVAPPQETEWEVSNIHRRYA